jgi:hypothetical protein
MKAKLFFMASMMFVLFKSNAQTAGALTFSLTVPKHATGNYETNGRYVSAIWIETNPTSGTSAFVKTLCANIGTSGITDHVATWTSKSGGNLVDVTSGATSTVFTPQTFTWNGTNASRVVVADGAYRVAVLITWGHGASTAIRYFPFVKGPSLDSQTPANDTNFTNISLNSSFLGVADFSSKPNVAIYPNPTNGIFNMDLKNDVDNIKVINILGKIVYYERITKGAAGTTKKIDLSNLVNGLYIVSLTNENGTSNYKVVLNK